MNKIENSHFINLNSNSNGGAVFFPQMIILIYLLISVCFIFALQQVLVVQSILIVI